MITALSYVEWAVSERYDRRRNPRSVAPGELFHAGAAKLDMLEAFIAKAKAEDASINRFGLGPHQEAYRVRFPAEADTDRAS